MSEYQYYEFQAIDRPLTERQMAALRGYSTRATITPTRFTNHYEWGSFKGNPSRWMERYFDAFLYLANWGTHQLMFRIPRRLLDLKLARRYCPGGPATVRSKGPHVILELVSDDEDSDWDDDGTGWLSSLVPLRADLAAGDHRMLYLAWLLSVQVGELDDDALEPACPPGLRKLTGPLRAFAEFLRIDPALIAAAASRSPDLEVPSRSSLPGRIARLRAAEKDAFLIKLAADGDAHLRADLLRRLRTEGKSARRTPDAAPRTVGQLLAHAERST
jgi:hypothetical protein